MSEETHASLGNPAEPVQIDQVTLDRLMREVRDNQNFSLGVLGGIAAGAVGAIIWGVVTALTGYQIGWMAVGVGFLVGFSVRRFGQGVDTVFGVSGAVISLLACLAGNLLTVCILIGRQEGMPVLDLVTRLDLNAAVEITKATFNPIDLLFYGIAVYEGYKFSFRRISQEEMERLATPQ